MLYMNLINRQKFYEKRHIDEKYRFVALNGNKAERGNYERIVICRKRIGGYM